MERNSGGNPNLAYAIRQVHAICCLAGSASYLDDIRADLRDCGISRAVRDHDTPVLFDWLVNRPDRTRGCRDHDGFASGGFADLEQPHVSSHAGHPEDAECGLNWCSRWIDLLQAGTIGQRMGLPAGTAYDDIALGKPGDVRGNHFADGATLHYIADANRLGAGRRVVHPAAHVRVERRPQRAQQHLARTGLWYRKFF
jgi:hypothetical protein